MSEPFMKTMPPLSSELYQLGLVGSSIKRLMRRNKRLRSEKKKLREMLVQLEFSNRHYCFFCCGWNNSPGGRGETPRRHRWDCPLKKLLKETA